MQSKFHENELHYKPPCLKFVTIKKSVIKPSWEEKKNYVRHILKYV